MTTNRCLHGPGWHSLATRSLFAAAGVAGALAATLAPAWAHLEPKPASAKAGVSTVVSFRAEHGCGDSPTVAVEFRVPAGAKGAVAVAKPGWKASSAADRIRFTGGPAAAHKATSFAIRFTPTAAGALVFKAVQTCAKGEIAWIEDSTAGAAEPDHPAPVVRVTK